MRLTKGDQSHTQLKSKKICIKESTTDEEIVVDQITPVDTHKISKKENLLQPYNTKCPKFLDPV